MKKLSFAFAFLFFVTFKISAQENSPKRLSVFKFYPLHLVTNQLSFGKETFNENRTRSTIITLGIRYRNWESTSVSGVQGQSQIDQFSHWKGMAATFERRFYVPEFGKKTGTWVDNNGTYGIYLAPSLKLDYNKNDFDKSYYAQIYDQVKNTTNTSLATFKGKSSYFGITPTMNLGLQFTIFQYMYIDLYVGGGLRILEKKENITKNIPLNSYGYFGNDNGAIDEFVLKSGVIPNGGISIGVKW